jgi:hypothetical protein
MKYVVCSIEYCFVSGADEIKPYIVMITILLKRRIVGLIGVLDGILRDVRF